MQQLRCVNLRPGDIMLKVADHEKSSLKGWFQGRGVERTVRDAQALVGAKNPNVAHAGLMFDSYYIIEAQAKGITPHDLRVQNRDVGYLVFRCKNDAMARGAGTCAKMLLDIHRAQPNRKSKRSLVAATGEAVGRAVQQISRGGVPITKGPLAYSLGGAIGSLRGPGGTAKTRDEMEDLLDAILTGQSRPFFCSQFVVYVYQYVAEQLQIEASQVFAGSDARVHPSNLATRLVANPRFQEAGYMIANER